MVVDFKKEQKNRLLILSGTEFFSCFSFFGTLSLLILFFVYNIHLPQKTSYELLGNFVALSFVASLIFGFIGGRYLSFRLMSLMGLLTYFFGYCFLIFYKKMLFVYFGLTLVATGFGLFEPNIRSLLGINYKNASDQERSSGFIVLHVFNIVGQLFGPILLTYLRVIHPSDMFLAAAIFIVLGIIFFAINYSDVAKLELFYENHNTEKYALKGMLAILFLIAIFFFILLKRDVKYILELMFLLVFAFFVIRLSSSEHSLRIRLCSIFIILFGLIAAEICFRQCFGVIDLFTKVYVNRVIMGIEFHTGLFESIEPFFILLMFYFIIKMRKNLELKGKGLSSGASISFGLFMLSVSFLFLMLGGYFSVNAKIPVIWLLAAYFFMAIGELFTLPVSTACVAKWSPDNWRGGMMGVWFLTAGFSSYLSAEVGKFISPHSGNPALKTYQDLFLILTVLAGIIAFLLYLFWKYWQHRYSVELTEVKIK